MHSENRIFVEAEFEEQTAAMAVFRNVRNTQLAPSARIRASERGTVERHLAADTCRLDEAGNRLDQLALSVAFDAGNADDLARTHIECHAVHNAARPGTYRQVANAENDLAGFCNGLLHA